MHVTICDYSYLLAVTWLVHEMHIFILVLPSTLHSGAVGLTGRTFYVPSTDTLVWLNGVGCSGAESRLAECPASPIGITYNCGRNAAGVRCAGIYNVQSSRPAPKVRGLI